MGALLLVLVAGVSLSLAYVTYGRWVSRRVFHLDATARTPAHEMGDERDFVPTPKSVVFGHHFTSIAGTGPIVGPAIAVMWGWLPAVLWVVLGSIFVGAVHDLGSLVISLRKRGRSIGDIAGDLLGPRARLIFLSILILGLWLVLAIFGLVIASVLRQYPAAVFPVLFQTPLAVVIGLVIHRRGKSIVLPSIVALGLMYLSVVFGDSSFGPTVGGLHWFNQWAASLPIWVWVIFLLAYSYVASVLPVWLLLQPRDYINALQLLSSLGLIVAGLVVAAVIGGAPVGSGGAVEGVAGGRERLALELVAPVVNWAPTGAPPLFPILFITIACGACSGFHCLVGSGATSKQVNRETDARAIAFGSMLTEGFLATLVIAACAAGIGLGMRHKLYYGLTSTEMDGRSAQASLFVAPRPHTEVRQLLIIRTGTNLRIPSATGPTIKNPSLYAVAAYAAPSFGLSLQESQYAAPYAIGMHKDKPDFYMYSGSRRLPPEVLAKDESLADITKLPDGGFFVTPNGETLTLTGSLAFNKQYESWSSAGGLARTVGAFVDGAANLVAAMGVPASLAVALMAVMVASFAATSMDTACRLQRYVIQELSALFLPKPPRHACRRCGYDMGAHVAAHGAAHGAGEVGGEVSASLVCPECGAAHSYAELSVDAQRHAGALAASREMASRLNPFRWLATTHGATLFAVVTAAALAAVPVPGQSWSLSSAGNGGLILWPLFGATNQLLAGFAFIVILAWLRATGRPYWFAVAPAILMLVVPAAALVWQTTIGNAENPSWLSTHNWLLVIVSAITFALELWLIVEAMLRWRRDGAWGAVNV